MPGALQFILNGRPQTVEGVDPHMTALQWLRERARLTGTKEGCAEGDCGACVIAVRRLISETPPEDVPGEPWRPINACICLLPMLHGLEVRTVEGIGPDVPESLAAHHSSQCGFCTPGFAMSLWVDHETNGAAPLDDVLAGNLCRCTGYAPIIRAGETLRRTPKAVDVSTPPLAAFDAAAPLTYEAVAARFDAPTDLDAAAALMAANPDARIVSGATDVGLWVTKERRRFDHIVWLGRIEALRQIERHDDALWIGAGATYANALPYFDQIAPDLGALVRRIGAPVRAVGTIGGNIANGSPIGDSPPPLIALGARLLLRSGPHYRNIPLEDFFIAYGRQDLHPGEFVVGVKIPIPADPAQLRVYKISKRRDQDISALCGAFNVAVVDGVATAARIAFGGMAAIPKRARAAERALIGRPWTARTAEDAAKALAEDYAPISDHRASAAHRLEVAQNLLRKYWLETANPRLATRIDSVEASSA